MDFRHPKEPVFVFPCTSVRIRFRGKKIRILVGNRHEYWKNYAGILSDGEQYAFALNPEGETELEIPLKPEWEEHEVMLFKRQDGCHYMTFQGLMLEEDALLLQATPPPARRIEVFGDSVSAGEVSEAIEFTGKEDPSHEGEFSNSWYSYAWIAARMLRAELHDIAQGGIALLDQTGWYHEPNAVGMTSIYDKIEYSPMLGEMVPWDFRLWTPDVVVVALGQNDSHPKDYMAEDPMGEQAKKWVKGYVKFLEKIRKVYPEAQIVCITTLLIHDPAWDHAIAEAIHRFRMTHQDPKVSHLLFSRNGSATPGHPRISEAREMAEELVGYINRLPIPAWK